MWRLVRSPLTRQGQIRTCSRGNTARGVPLVTGLPIPNERLRKVLRYTLAQDVHPTEDYLRSRVSLFRRRTQKSQRRDIVAALISRYGILQRRCLLTEQRAKEPFDLWMHDLARA